MFTAKDYLSEDRSFSLSTAPIICIQVNKIKTKMQSITSKKKTSNERTHK